MEGLHFELLSPPVTIADGVLASESIVLMWCVTGVIFLLALVFRFVVFPRFKDKPRGVQNILELIVESCHKFTLSIGGHELSGLGSYIFSVGVMLMFGGLTELFGFRPPTSDILLTLTLAVFSFIIINFYGFRKKGFFGRFRSLGKAYIVPIRVLTEVAVPISMACRLFGNTLGGMIVMELLYGVCAPIIPGVFAIYFNLFHVGMQTYIFLTLTLTFTREAIE